MNPSRIELKEANAFVSNFHRHHKPVVGHRFSVAAERERVKLWELQFAGALSQENAIKSIH